MVAGRRLGHLATVAPVLTGLVLLAALVTGAVVAGTGRSGEAAPGPDHRTAAEPRSAVASASGGGSASAPTRTTAAQPPPPPPATLPGGRTRVFEGNRFLVAYYGTAGSGALGVLGEGSPERMQRRLTRAAAPFAQPGRPVQPVYELIVTIADARPGKDGDYNHDISRRQVQAYLDAAHRHGALVVLDVQPGHARFESVVRRWAWALRDPSVGLALDPEWRMARGGSPGRRIGTVGAAEVNRVSAMLATFVARHRLPEKLFVLHQFRRDMIVRPGRIVPRPGLAMVQHVDGFGTRREKLATYHHVARPRQFTMGFKLFYDEDVHRMGAAAVRQVRPGIRFVSFQ